eukprot:312350-Chlamydomonas_euryale.AAC.1
MVSGSASASATVGCEGTWTKRQRLAGGWRALVSNNGVRRCEGGGVERQQQADGEWQHHRQRKNARALTCTTHMYNAHVQRTCTTHMYNAHAQRTCTTHMYNARPKAQTWTCARTHAPASTLVRVHPHPHLC